MVDLPLRGVDCCAKGVAVKILCIFGVADAAVTTATAATAAVVG